MTHRILATTGMLVIFIGMSAWQLPARAQENPDNPPPAAEAASEQPKTDEPKADEPKADEPKADEPKADEPKADEPVGESESESAAAEGSARARFDTVFAQFKEGLKQLRTLQHDYQEADLEGREQIEKKFAEQVAKGNALLPELQAAAVDAYLEAPNEDRELTRFLVKMLQDNVKHDQYDLAVKTGQALVENDCRSKQIFEPAGIANFAVHHFDVAAELLAKAQSAGVAGREATVIMEAIPDYQGYWEKEQELRKAEAQADDLPRVKLTTNKGDIVVELFENEAPDTVGNFVSLVKKGFYDGLTFHRVIPGFMAQAGCPNGDGSGGPGYRIYDECKKPDARMHFRGSLSMAKTAAPDTGGSQFFITFRPTPHLNRQHTVFGRVIEGMDVVDALQVTETGTGADDEAEKPEPDKIIKAEVLRDRGHEYLPNKVE